MRARKLKNNPETGEFFPCAGFHPLFETVSKKANSRWLSKFQTHDGATIEIFARSEARRYFLVIVREVRQDQDETRVRRIYRLNDNGSCWTGEERRIPTVAPKEGPLNFGRKWDRASTLDKDSSMQWLYKRLSDVAQMIDGAIQVDFEEAPAIVPVEMLKALHAVM